MWILKKKDNNSQSLHTSEQMAALVYLLGPLTFTAVEKEQLPVAVCAYSDDSTMRSNFEELCVKESRVDFHIFTPSHLFTVRWSW